MNQSSFTLDDKTILITGGTGSFGKKFVEMTLQRYNPKRLIIYSRDEYKQDVLRKYVEREFPEKAKRMRFFIGDVRDKDRLARAFKGVDYIVHAAAMKQVVTCEYNPFEAVKTNVHGAQNIIDLAIDSNVKKVVALSTDKAVNPINLYGGTKLISDKLFISSNIYSGGVGTIFSIVRYGNVVGSRGSVIPLFQELLDAGEREFPIMDNEMTRFWITLDECVELVYRALDMSMGGETFVSKIPSFRITDLALAMGPECTQKEVGIREGEKIHEIMITRDDARLTYEYDQYYIVYPHFNKWTPQTHYHEGGKPVPRDFKYASNTNSQWLSVELLKKELALL